MHHIFLQLRPIEKYFKNKINGKWFFFLHKEGFKIFFKIIFHFISFSDISFLNFVFPNWNCQIYLFFINFQKQFLQYQRNGNLRLYFVVVWLLFSYQLIRFAEYIWYWFPLKSKCLIHQMLGWNLWIFLQ